MRERRETAAAALKAYLDGVRPTDAVLVAGDFNDDIDESIAADRETPYAGFLADPDDYGFATAPLTAAGETSTVFYDDVIDHHLATDELAADFIDGSATVVPAGEYVPAYGETTSDHYPVVTRYRRGGG